MAIHPLPSARVAFGPFELDASGSELRKSGVRLRLTGQPFEILLVLLAHPGEVVTREQLRERIWKEGTFVDFEHGLSAAMNKLRRSLGDSADNPRYIETVPGRGYRFIGLVQERSSVAAVAPVSHEMLTEVADQVAKPDSRKSWLAIGAVTGGVFVACLVMWMALQRPVSRSDVRVQQLTTNSAENPIWRAVISPDGRYLAYGDVAGIQVQLISTGESHLLPRPRSLTAGDVWFPAAWLPDGTRILANSITSTAVTAWTVSVIGGAAALLRDNALVLSRPLRTDRSSLSSPPAIWPVRRTQSTDVFCGTARSGPWARTEKTPGEWYMATT